MIAALTANLRPAIAQAIFLAIQCVVYFGVEKFEGPPHDIYRKIDEKIPFQPAWVYIYILWFPLIFITKESAKTVLLAVTRLQGQYTTDWPKLLTVLTLSSLPVIALYLAMSQSFIKGLTAGAVKG